MSPQKSEAPAQGTSEPSEEVVQLVEERQDARAEQDWERSDELREAIEQAGWRVQDTTEGSVLLPFDEGFDEESAGRRNDWCWWPAILAQGRHR